MNTETTMRWSLHPVDRFDQFAAAWDRLNAASGGAPFLFADFIRPLLREFGGGAERLAVLGAPGAEQAIGIVYPKRPGIWETFQPSQLPLGAWVMAPGLDYDALAAGLLRALPGLALMLCFTQQDALFHPRPADGGRIRTLDYIRVGWVPIEGTFDDYWKARSKSLRQNMRTQRSRLGREGVTPRMEVVDSADDVAAAIRDYARLESTGWKGEAGTAVTEGSAQARFYQAAMEAFCRRGAGRIYRYLFNDRVVAAELHVAHGPIMVLLKTAYDESIEGVSPAALMREEMYQQLFAEGRIRRMEYYGRVMDWTLRWTDQVRTLFHVNAYRWPVLAALHRWLIERRKRGTASVPPADPAAGATAGSAG